MQLTQMQHDILSFMASRPVVSVRDVCAGLLINYDTARSALNLFVSNGLAAKAEKVGLSWHYKLRPGAVDSLKEGQKPGSANKRVLLERLARLDPGQRKDAPAKAVKAIKATRSAPSFSAYVIPAMVSSRLGADDHKAFKSKGF